MPVPDPESEQGRCGIVACAVGVPKFRPGSSDSAWKGLPRIKATFAINSFQSKYIKEVITMSEVTFYFSMGGKKYW
jgi:hypothetical protein